MKDPLVSELTSYEIFGVDPVTARMGDVQANFARVQHEAGGTTRATTAMSQIIQPHKRITLDILNYYWVEQTTERSAEVQETDATAMVRRTLAEAYPLDEIDFPLWTDLDSADFSMDFRPIERTQVDLAGLESSFREMDPTELLDQPRPDF